MAKQKGAILFNGKFANAVGYKAYDGRGDSFQGMRVYQAEVANPQTLSQMSQRMKLTPVQNFYRGMQYLLNHSWQGVKYKNPSRLHFYSQAMRALSTYGVPYVPKGDRTFVPWRFPVSSGSVAANTTITLSQGTAGTGLSVGENNQPSTIGELAQALIENSFLKAGDQLTFVRVLKVGDEFIPKWGRLVLNVNSETALSDLIDDTEVGVDILFNDGNLSFTDRDQSASVNMVAAALIVSRLQNNVWERSNSVMAVDASIIQQYNSSTAFAAMLASYQKTKNTDSDWYLNDGTAADEPEAVASIKSGTITSGSSTISFAYYDINGQKVVPYHSERDSEMQTHVYFYTRINGSTIQRASQSYGLTALENFDGSEYTTMVDATFQSTYPEITVQS